MDRISNSMQTPMQTSENKLSRVTNSIKSVPHSFKKSCMRLFSNLKSVGSSRETLKSKAQSDVVRTHPENNMHLANNMHQGISNTLRDLEPIYQEPVDSRQKITPWNIVHSPQNPECEYQEVWSEPVYQNIAHSPQKPEPIYQNIAHSPQKPEPIYQSIAHSPQKPEPIYQSVAHSPQKPEPIYQSVAHSPQKPEPIYQSVAHSPQKPEPIYQEVIRAPKKTTDEPQDVKNLSVKERAKVLNNQAASSNNSLSPVNKSGVATTKRTPANNAFTAKQAFIQRNVVFQDVTSRSLANK